MDEQLKHRVVGAIVLVLAAVVFVPMLLDGPHELDGEFQMRQHPADSVNGYDAGVHGRDHRPARAQGPGRDGQTTERKGRTLPSGLALADESSASGLAARRSEGKPSSHASRPGEQTVENPLKTAFSNMSETQREFRDTSAPSSSTRGWVVQMGSFAQQDNAIALRDRLQALGYNTFVEVVPYKSSLVTRVNIGPEARKGVAQELSRRLKTREELAGIVRPYPE